jgi:hypothetical protein
MPTPADFAVFFIRPDGSERNIAATYTYAQAQLELELAAANSPGNYAIQHNETGRRTLFTVAPNTRPRPT